LLSNTVYAKGSYFTIGVVNLPPMVSIEGPDRTIKGILIDYFQKHIINEEIKINFMEIPFNRVLVELQTGKINGFLTTVYSEDRAKIINFTGTPLFIEHATVCHMKN